MKVLYLSKALVVGSYQTKMEALARQPEIDLVAAVPPVWKDERGETTLERAHLEGYRLRVVPMRFNGSFHGHYYPSIARVLDEEAPDLFHIDEEPYNLGAFHAAWHARRRSIPFLFLTWQNLFRRYPPPFNWMERWLYRRTSHAIAGNREAAQVLRRKGYSGTIEVIPQFGVDPASFPPRPTPHARGQVPVIGYAGRFVPEKGLAVLLKALAGLRALPWELELRGSGPQRAELDALAAQLGVGDRVRVQPPLPSTRMSEFYHEIDIFVLPSRTMPNWKEQFGRVLIEAMVSGVTVVGSDSGEIPHVIGDAGLVTPEGDAPSLCHALERLLTSPGLRAELAAAGRQRVLDHFTQAAIATQTAALYREMLGCATPS